MAALGPPPTSGLAIASMVLGLIGLLAIPLVASIAAVICGHLAKSQIRQAAGRLAGDGFAPTGLITGYLGILVSLAFVILIVVGISAAVNSLP